MKSIQSRPPEFPDSGNIRPPGQKGDSDARRILKGSLSLFVDLWVRNRWRQSHKESPRASSIVASRIKVNILAPRVAPNYDFLMNFLELEKWVRRAISTLYDHDSQLLKQDVFVCEPHPLN